MNFIDPLFHFSVLVLPTQLLVLLPKVGSFQIFWRLDSWDAMESSHLAKDENGGLRHPYHATQLLPVHSHFALRSQGLSDIQSQLFLYHIWNIGEQDTS